jgi:hypothetical protein
VLDVPADRQRCEDDGQVGFDRVLDAVVDGPGSISRDPRCQEYTICTAVAPEAVFTVRTYGTRQLYGPD